ncbi:MAG: hypothetical protein LBB73_05830 [Dysgonamonadaceae bacterium]|jgi:hypothetical protein|nr:hypothetical protein [Dysgonamonadaceae bacterium]
MDKIPSCVLPVYDFCAGKDNNYYNNKQKVFPVILFEALFFEIIQKELTFVLKFLYQVNLSNFAALCMK